MNFLRFLTITFAASLVVHGQTAQTKPAIDIRDTPGVDCSGAADSSAALNGLFQNISGRKVIIPTNCALKAANQIVIQGQTDFLIEGEGFQPNQSNGPAITGCGGTPGPVLYINRSSYFTLSGFGIYAKSNACSSSFSGSLAWNNSGSGGFTSTFAKFQGMAVSSSITGGSLPGYFGFAVGVDNNGIAGNAPNLEQATFEDNWMHCQNSPGSYGIWMTGAGNADNASAVNNRISGCFHAIHQDRGNLKTIERNHFGNDGGYSVFGSHGAAIYVFSCSSGGMNLISNEASDGGPFYSMANDVTTSGGGGCPVNMIGNVIGISDLAPSAYPINLGIQNHPYILIGNQINLTGHTANTVIGSSAQTNCRYGPLGEFIDIGNTLNYGASAAGWSGCFDGKVIHPFQGGEFRQGSPYIH